MSIKGPAGNDLHFGREVSTGIEGATKPTEFKLTGQSNPVRGKVQHYETEATASAAKQRGEALVPGDYAWGGIVPGPVQSVDAATVAETFSGKSWEKLKAKSGGNPYSLPIYDAFKSDANSYDTVLEEVNKNWLDVGMKWSYLKEIDSAIDNAIKNFKQKVNARGIDSPLTDNEKLYLQSLLVLGKTKQGKLYLPEYLSKVGKVIDVRDSNDKAFSAAWRSMESMMKKMKAVGYDVSNPPATPTLRHQQAFVNALASSLKIKPRLNALIKKTERNKQILKQELLKQGYKTPSGERIALQYYSH